MKMDAFEIAKFSSFDGYNSGIGAPTRTTATLTPTTLRNIEQTFLELTNETSSIPCQAGFVPPLAPSYNSVTDPEQSMDSSSMSNSSWQTTPPPPSTMEDMNDSQPATKGKRRNMGGRRPNKASNISPEEEEKRRVRRERNKLAAARCRRRREDHTNELLKETEQLEKKKQALQQEVQELQTEKEELEFLLKAHRAQCKRPGRPLSPLDVKPVIAQTMLALADKIKEEPVDNFDSDGPPSPKKVLLSSAVLSAPSMQPANAISITNTKPNRPTSLNVPLVITPSQALNSIPINTPSNGIFNFESLMDGGTGLTPVNHPLVPNGPRNAADLITPTSDPSKLCSL